LTNSNSNSEPEVHPGVGYFVGLLVGDSVIAP
jgi:hypothetical protein